MAGESAREVARRAREKAERLNRRAELFEQGAEGEAATARVLEGLPSGWTSLHDVRWPGRRLANVDHVVVGPGGIFVIDSKNWTGRVSTAGGVLRQNARSREKAVAGGADASLAVAELAGPYATFVSAVICFAGRADLSGWCRDVMICGTDNLLQMLITRPVVLAPEQVADAAMRLDLALRSALGLQARRTPSPSRSLRAPAPMPVRGTSQRSRRSPKRRPSVGRFLFGLAMIFVLLTFGPQLAHLVGDTVAGLLTSNVGAKG